MYASMRKTCPDFCLSWYSLYLPSSVALRFFLQGVKELNKNTINPDLCRRKEVGCLRFCRRKEVGCLSFLYNANQGIFSSGKFRLVRSRSRPKNFYQTLVSIKKCCEIQQRGDRTLVSILAHPRSDLRLGSLRIFPPSLTFEF